MKEFTVFSAEGVALRRGTCREEDFAAQARDGEYVQEGIDMPPCCPHNTDYVAQRLAAYPPIADQLDALWKGGEAMESMRARVLAVKTTHPKPSVP